MHRPRLGVLASHPIQYQAPLFRELGQHVELMVFFAHQQTAQAQAEAGFGVAFEWDVDLLGGYNHRFLPNLAAHPGVGRFLDCDTPAIADEIQKGKFDAFLVMGWYLKSYWQAIRACQRHGIPVMVRGDSQLGTPRGWFKQQIKEIIYPWILRNFDACLFVGKKNRDYLEHYGVPDKRLFFSPHCIDTESFRQGARQADRQLVRSRLGVGAGGKIVLFVGKLLERKHPLDMVAALRILRDDGWNVRGVFAGDGPQRAALEEAGVSSDVPLHFLGFKNQTELPEIYVAADVLVLPSDGSETWGLVVNEALACGTPVVVSDAVGCGPDLARLGESGEVFPARNVESLASALQRILSVPPTPAEMASVADAYSIAAAARGVFQALEWVMGPEKGLP